ncbi:MAG TPA: coproporphyrinogen-III oxidase family protein, partial [Gemmatimonadales bacterium]|nr:coproporphyrinogen-III oxidase family protein [Gemmatimonadales bacterium]
MTTGGSRGEHSTPIAASLSPSKGSREGNTAPTSSSTPPIADDTGHTLYLGGGTPSLLPVDSLAELLTSLLDVFPRRSSSTPSRDAFSQRLSRNASPATPLLDAFAVSDVVEVSLEVNPEDVTPSNAAVWRAAGVNRISLGAQSFDDRVLEWMHRLHTADRTREAVRVLRDAGFDNISLDLIFALPEALQRDWSRDLDQVIALEPEHLSLYGLTVEDRTPLARWVSRGAAVPPDDDRYAAEYLAAHDRLGAAGYAFYEVSNASRPGKHSRHNSAYWSGASYVGLGPAAHSFDGHTRRWNIPAWEAYRTAIAAGKSPVESEEALTDEQRQLEHVYLGLRTSVGLPLTASPSDR